MSRVPHDLHEGSWLYVSAHVEPLDRVRSVCRGHGWPVIVGSDLDPARRAQALRLADACIVDAAAADELATAIAQQRPVVALRQAGSPPGERLDGVHELPYGDHDECAEALGRLLADPDWRRHVAHAAPTDHA